MANMYDMFYVMLCVCRIYTLLEKNNGWALVIHLNQILDELSLWSVRTQSCCTRCCVSKVQYRHHHSKQVSCLIILRESWNYAKECFKAHAMHYVWLSQFWSHFCETNALFASKAKINVVWNFFYTPGTLRAPSVRKKFQTMLILAFEENSAFVPQKWDQNCESHT